MIVSELINRSLQDLNLTDGQQPAAPDDVQLAFDRLNDFLDDLKNDNLIVYTITRTTWTLVASQASYTVGTGGDIPIARPVNPNDITNIGYVDNSLTPAAEYPQGPPLTDDAYAAVPFKSLTSTIPAAWYYNPTYGTTGRGTLYPLPIPTQASLLGVLYTLTPVSEFTALTDTISLPPGFRRYFRNQLTIEIASAFEKEPPETVLRARDESLRKIKRTNERLVDVTFDAALVPIGYRSNIYTGQ